MKRFLITTADEHTWKSDIPILFLGEWCRQYNRKEYWQKLDAIVAEPFGVKKEEKIKNIKYIDEVIDRLLPELTLSLNQFHNENHTTRYWHILIGNWLQRYVEVIFNRYFNLEETIKNYEISSTVVFENPSFCFAPNDTNGFVKACLDDQWNHFTYTEILKFMGKLKLEINPLSFSRPELLIKNESNLNNKEKFLIHFGKILSKFHRPTDAFIINSYLPKKSEMLLQVLLGQIPQFWKSPPFEIPEYSERIRNKFNMDHFSYEGFEKFLRIHLVKSFPICFLEGYPALKKTRDNLPWPKNPKFIFTSNNFDFDEVFKMWAAEKVEYGVNYFTGQHGNNYGTVYNYSRKPEIVTSDKFITWGWSDNNPKIKPAFLFKTLNKKRCYNKNGGLLLIELCVNDRLYHFDDVFESCVYQESQFRFVESLPDSIQKLLIVRLSSVYKNHKWFEDHRWRDFNKQIKINEGIGKIDTLIADSRIIVHSYDSTGILETLSLNIPTICFWNGGLEHLEEEVKPFYESLQKVGILANSPEDAAKLVALHWENVDDWWMQNELQKVREEFCNKFARTSKNPLRLVRSILTE